MIIKNEENPTIDILQYLIVNGKLSMEETLEGELNNKIKKINAKLGFDITRKIPIKDGEQSRYHFNCGRAFARKYNCPNQIYAKSFSLLVDKIYSFVFSEQKITLAEAYEKWLVYKVTEVGADSKTIKETKCEWNRFFKNDKVSSMPLEKITSDDIVELFLRMTKDHSISHKRFVTAKSVLNGIFNHYKRSTHYNPIDDVDLSIMKGRFKPEGGDDIENYFSDSDIEAIYKHLMPSDNIYDQAICFALNSILRIGEIQGLKYSDYDSTTGCLQIVRSTRTAPEVKIIDGKVELGKKKYTTEPRLKGNLTKSKRKIPLSEDAIKIIESVHQSNPNGEYLFEYQGRQITGDTVNDHLKASCKACGVKYRSVHKIRFYNARRLYAAIGLAKTSYMLGHSSTAQTLHYIKADILQDKDIDMARDVLIPGNATKSRIIRIA